MTDKEPAPLGGKSGISSLTPEEMIMLRQGISEDVNRKAAQEIRDLRARLSDALILLNDALRCQLDLCNHSDIGKPGCRICDAVRLDRVRK